jgi:hypothetical protein
VVAPEVYVAHGGVVNGPLVQIVLTGQGIDGDELGEAVVEVGLMLRVGVGVVLVVVMVGVVVQPFVWI